MVLLNMDNKQLMNRIIELSDKIAEIMEKIEIIERNNLCISAANQLIIQINKNNK